MTSSRDIPVVNPEAQRHPVHDVLRRVFSNNVGPYTYRPAGILFGVLGLLSLFQLALVFGAPIGRAAWGGGHDVLPMNLRLGSAAAIAIYVAVIWLARRRLQQPSSRFVRVVMWVLVGYFSFGVVLNAASSSAWERYLMSPVALGLAWSCWAIVRARVEDDPSTHVNS